MEENKELEFLNNETAPSNFILDFIDEDLKEGVYDRVQTCRKIRRNMQFKA